MTLRRLVLCRDSSTTNADRVGRAGEVTSSPFEGAAAAVTATARTGEGDDAFSGPADSAPVLHPCIIPVLPVGGRVSAHLTAWQGITDDRWTLSVVEQGYRPFFVRRPALCTVPPWESASSPSTELTEEIGALLEKRAVQECIDFHVPGFYSPIFLVPKKTGGRRLIFNLKCLNQCLDVPHFKMETLLSVREALRQGHWSVSIDLQDAYLHVPIHQKYRRLLRFVYKGKVYQFNVLPFGLATAPLVFTTLMKPVLAFCHRRGCLLSAFLDDWILHHADVSVLRNQLQFLLTTLCSLGLGVNETKSRFRPMQQFVFLGTDFDLHQALVRPTQQRIEAIEKHIGPLLINQRFTVRELSAAIGILDSTASVVPFGAWRVRPLHWFRKCHWSAETGSYDDVLLQTCDFPHSALQWWMDASNLLPGVPLHEPAPHDILFTDASLEGWGAHLSAHRVAGSWTPSQQLLHINVLELTAVLLALREFLPFCRNRVIQVQTDNTTAVSYLRKGGGTHSASLHHVASEIFVLCIENGIHLLSLHIPGRLNETADALSRGKHLPTTEWCLQQSCCDGLFLLWGVPYVDLFASRVNRRVSQFVSALPDPLAWGSDALTMDWSGLYAYLFPPFALLLRVLRKIQSSPGRFLLIAPNWPAQPWFPVLLSLLIDHPRVLPPHPYLLTQSGGHRAHPDIHVLQLHGWMLSQDVQLQTDFRRKLPLESLNPSALPRLPSTTPNGAGGCVGVMEGKLIHSLPL